MPLDLTLLTPLALAHWIMQDGAKASSKGLYLCTDSFTLEDTQRLSLFLNKTYNLKVTTPPPPPEGGGGQYLINKTV